MRQLIPRRCLRHLWDMAQSRDMSLHARRLQIIMQGMALRLILQQFLFQTELRAIQEISQNFFQMIM